VPTCSNEKNIVSVFNEFSNGLKRVELSNTKTFLTWHVRPRLQNQKHVHPGQLDRSGPDNTYIGWGLDKFDRSAILTPVEVTTLNTGQYLPMLEGLTDSSTSYLLWLLPLTLNNPPRHGTISFDTGQPLSPTSRLRAWMAYVLSRVHKIHVSCYVAIRDTHQPSMSTLAQEHRRSTLRSWTPQPTNYL